MTQGDTYETRHGGRTIVCRRSPGGEWHALISPGQMIGPYECLASAVGHAVLLVDEGQRLLEPAPSTGAYEQAKLIVDRAVSHGACSFQVGPDRFELTAMLAGMVLHRNTARWCTGDSATMLRVISQFLDNGVTHEEV